MTDSISRAYSNGLKTDAKTKYVHRPYSFKPKLLLLCQEIAPLGIYAHLALKKNSNENENIFNHSKSHQLVSTYDMPGAVKDILCILFYWIPVESH